MNQEIDFTEFSYDIKLFKIQRKSPFGQGTLNVGTETLAYHLEMFNINEPDIVFKYKIPVSEDNNKVTDSAGFMSEVVNLIDHPFKE